LSACDFCDEFRGGFANAFALRYGTEISDRRIFLGETVCVIPSLGQIVEGHVLLAPLVHLTALSDMVSNEIEEIESLCHHARAALRRIYGTCIFFEHGVGRAGTGGCGIEHAHMHAVPVTGNGVLNILMQSFEGHQIRHLADIGRAIPPNSSYLFFENAIGERYVFAAPTMPSQYMRKLTCESIGKPDWDWRQAGREPDLFATIKRLSPAFSAALAIPRE
jgi:diadenosine tetraphosphate (Ap4A) HIT family hydrolase